MATDQPTSGAPYFQPRPGVDGLAARYMLWRLVEKVSVSATGCWEWNDARSNTGYAVLSLKNPDWSESAVLLHRVAYSVCVEALPPDMSVYHHCDNPPCLRPDHLFLGTNSDNVADKMTKGREARGESVTKNRRTAKGERVGTSRLTAEQVLDIRRRFLACEKPSDIAASIGISDTQVNYVVRGKAWAHLPLIYTGSMKERARPRCGQVFATRQGILYTHVTECTVDLILGKE